MWWINLANAIRRCEKHREAEAILLRARELNHDDALLEFNLACYASVSGRMGEARSRLRRAIELDKAVRKLALDDEDLKAVVALDRDAGVGGLSEPIDTLKWQ